VRLLSFMSGIDARLVSGELPARACCRSDSRASSAGQRAGALQAAGSNTPLNISSSESPTNIAPRDILQSNLTWRL